MSTAIVAVHAGAGSYSKDKLEPLKKICTKACKEAVVKLKHGLNSVSAITIATSILEDSPQANAGTGSCLTISGTVECDASIMRGDGACGVVAAVNGIKNPVRLAHEILKEQSNGLLSLGRIPPICLCGDGARVWGADHGVPVCDPDELISDCSKEVYIDHMSRMEDHFEEPPTKRAAVDQNDDRYQSLDTVGAVCIDVSGSISACCSSGGISLKHSGRIGQAGVYGCGCYAQGCPGNDRVAVSTSGVGETLIKTTLAKTMASSLLSKSFTSVAQSFQEHYLDSPLLDDFCPKLAGLISLNVSSNGHSELSWVHSTEDMLIVYMTTKDKEPKVILSTQANNDSKDSKGNKPILRVCAGGVSIKLQDT